MDGAVSRVVLPVSVTEPDIGLLRRNRGSPVSFRALSSAAAAFVLFAISGCDRGSGELREWSPGEHDQPSTPQGQVSGRPSTEGPDPMLLDMAWRKNCTPCHGPTGRGDGPQGPMMRAPDLSRADWQQNITDDEMASVIRNGKNKMPKFDLPDQVVSGLVQRVRSFRAK